MNLVTSLKRLFSRAGIEVTVKNLSLTGAFIEVSNKDLCLHDKVKIAVVLFDRERELSATVVWKNETGVGVKFIYKNSQDMQIVDDLIYFSKNRD